ncbi:MAG: hypothetical protein BWY84_00401 [Candidatus Aerophobetes bacterium ADurb.Bin490]|nr:MAG: hypothetical protein BWY84_00401 [Candidatus Aerophobetes bacterium ADurb.Bin490]
MQPESSKEFLTELVKIPSVNQYITQKPCPEAPVGNYIKETALSFGLQARFLEVPGCAPNTLTPGRRWNVARPGPVSDRGPPIGDSGAGSEVGEPDRHLAGRRLRGIRAVHDVPAV